MQLNQFAVDLLGMHGVERGLGWTEVLADWRLTILGESYWILTGIVWKLGVYWVNVPKTHAVEIRDVGLGVFVANQTQLVDWMEAENAVESTLCKF